MINKLSKHVYKCKCGQLTETFIWSYELPKHKFKCTKCSLDYKNLFGFMWKGKFKKYDSYLASINDYRKWQLKWWKPYKKRHPDKSYYDFLHWIKYCDNMENYVRTIKLI